MFRLLLRVVLLLDRQVGTERIELKFSLKIALAEHMCLANKLRSEIRHVVAVQSNALKSISDSTIFTTYT